MLTRIILSLSCLLAFGLNAQLPTTNIYQFSMVKAANKFSITQAQLLTEFNSNGYNNQPSFFEDDVVYFTTDYYGQHTEIAKFDFFDKILTRITYTPESEYSPTPVPNKENFSCVRVESDQKTQSLSVYPNDGIGYAKRYMNNTRNIGYHAWIDAETLALFLVEEPYHNLAIADARSERRKIILDKIGRTLKVTRDNQLLFVHKLSDVEWVIKSYDKISSQSKTVVNAIPGVEDFELLSDGSLISGSGSQLYRFDPKKDKAWQPLIDLKAYGIENISRIVARKKRLLIVDQKA
ncbi:MAG: hypothetical protein HKO66_11985 [Saprospiraceae bacterium]|nr:hypothetical protein [Bacteroidia bacterium]NNE15770.1 hypothetical protein [Saprospiraceae bacterium]NNL92949.1 hypothetical protein [Saprospiraceae bacterium]